MPPVSEKQRRAMRAAASGDSTLGIPKSVGEDFNAADLGGKLPPSAPTDRQANLKGNAPPRGLQSMIGKPKGKK